MEKNVFLGFMVESVVLGVSFGMWQDSWAAGAFMMVVGVIWVMSLDAFFSRYKY